MKSAILIFVLHLCGAPTYFIGIDPNTTPTTYLAYPVEMIGSVPEASQLFTQLLKEPNKKMHDVELSNISKGECI